MPSSSTELQRNRSCSRLRKKAWNRLVSIDSDRRFSHRISENKQWVKAGCSFEQRHCCLDGKTQLATDAIIVLKHMHNNYRSDCQDFNQIRIWFGAPPPLLWDWMSDEPTKRSTKWPLLILRITFHKRRIKPPFSRLIWCSFHCPFTSHTTLTAQLQNAIILWLRDSEVGRPGGEKQATAAHWKIQLIILTCSHTYSTIMCVCARVQVYLTDHCVCFETEGLECVYIRE